MSGSVAKLLRKTANGDPKKYKLLKKLYPALPADKRTKAKFMASDLAELYRQHEELNKLGINPPVEVK